MGASYWEVLVKFPSSTKMTFYIIQVLRVVRPAAWCLGLPTRYKSNQIKSNQIKSRIFSYKLKFTTTKYTLRSTCLCATKTTRRRLSSRHNFGKGGNVGRGRGRGGGRGLCQHFHSNSDQLNYNHSTESWWRDGERGGGDKVSLYL